MKLDVSHSELANMSHAIKGNPMLHHGHMACVHFLLAGGGKSTAALMDLGVSYLLVLRLPKSIKEHIRC